MGVCVFRRTLFSLARCPFCHTTNTERNSKFGLQAKTIIVKHWPHPFFIHHESGKLTSDIPEHSSIFVTQHYRLQMSSLFYFNYTNKSSESYTPVVDVLYHSMWCFQYHKCEHTVTDWEPYLQKTL